MVDYYTAVKRSDQLLVTNVTVSRRQTLKSSQVQLHLYEVKPSQLRTVSQVRWWSPFGGNERSGHVEGLWVSVAFCFFIEVVATLMSSHGENPCRTHDLCILCICHASIKKST